MTGRGDWQTAVGVQSERAPVPVATASVLTLPHRSLLGYSSGSFNTLQEYPGVRKWGNGRRLHALDSLLQGMLTKPR